MRSETTTLTSTQDGLPLFVRTWLPDGEAKGVTPTSSAGDAGTVLVGDQETPLKESIDAWLAQRD